MQAETVEPMRAGARRADELHRLPSMIEHLHALTLGDDEVVSADNDGDRLFKLPTSAPIRADGVQHPATRRVEDLQPVVVSVAHKQLGAASRPLKQREAVREAELPEGAALAADGLADGLEKLWVVPHDAMIVAVRDKERRRTATHLWCEEREALGRGEFTEAAAWAASHASRGEVIDVQSVQPMCGGVGNKERCRIARDPGGLAQDRQAARLLEALCALPREQGDPVRVGHAQLTTRQRNRAPRMLQKERALSRCEDRHLDRHMLWTGV